MTKKIFFLVLLFIWLIIFFSLISATSGYTSLKIKSEINKNLLTLTPQGWGFFTRNPREENIILYKLDNGENIKQVTNKNFTPSNYFGLSRRQRYEAIQISMLLSDIKEEKFLRCDQANFQDCNLCKVKINRDGLIHTGYFTGTYFIKKEKTIPWAWSKSKENLINPYKIIELEFE